MSNNPMKGIKYVRLHSKEYITKNCRPLPKEDEVIAYEPPEMDEDGVFFVDQMFEYCGKIVRITSEGYEDKTGWRIRPWMCTDMYTLEEMKEKYPEYLV